MFDFDQAQHPVGQNDDDGIQAQPAGRDEFARHHGKAPVAGDARHGRIRPAEGCGQGRRDTESHGGPAVGHQEAVRGRGGPELADQVGVGAHVTGQDAFGRQDVPEDVQGFHRAQIAGAGVQRRVQVLPVLCKGGEIPIGGQRRHGRQGFQCAFKIADAGGGQFMGRGELRGRRIDMHQRGRRQPGFVVELHRVVAQTDHQVGLVGDVGQAVAAGMEQNAGIGRMGFGQQPLGHGRQHHRRRDDLQQARQGTGQTLASGGQPHGQQGAACLADQVEGGLKVAFRDRRGRLRGDGGRCVRLGLPGVQIHRQADVNRAGNFATSRGHGLVDGGGQGVGLGAGGPFGEGPEKRLVVHVHLGHPVAHGIALLGGGGDQAGTVEEGTANAGGQVGGTGAEGAVAQRRLAGQSKADIGHEAGRSLVGYQDEGHAPSPHGLHIGNPRASRNAESIPDPMRHQTIHKYFRDLRHGMRFLRLKMIKEVSWTAVCLYHNPPEGRNFSGGRISPASLRRDDRLD